MDEVKSAEAELRQDKQLAKIDTKTVMIGEHSIESSTSAKNLGVTYDNWEWTYMSTTSLAAVFISWDSWDPSDDHFPRMPRKHWSIPYIK